MNKYIENIVRAVREHQPVSPFALHLHCGGEASAAVVGEMRNLRAALQVAVRTGLVEMTPNFTLVLPATPPDLGAGDPSSSPDAAGPDSSTARPTPNQGSPQPPPPSPTGHPTTESRPASQTGSRTHVLHYAIQIELASLSRLEGELRTYLQAARRRNDDTVRRGVYDLLRTVEAARRECEESDRWLRESQPPNTSG